MLTDTRLPQQSPSVIQSVTQSACSRTRACHSRHSLTHSPTHSVTRAWHSRHYAPAETALHELEAEAAQAADELAALESELAGMGERVRRAEGGVRAQQARRTLDDIRSKVSDRVGE